MDARTLAIGVGALAVGGGVAWWIYDKTRSGELGGGATNLDSTDFGTANGLHYQWHSHPDGSFETTCEPTSTGGTRCETTQGTTVSRTYSSGSATITAAGRALSASSIEDAIDAARKIARRDDTFGFPSTSGNDSVIVRQGDGYQVAPLVWGERFDARSLGDVDDRVVAVVNEQYDDSRDVMTSPSKLEFVVSDHATAAERDALGRSVRV